MVTDRRLLKKEGARGYRLDVREIQTFVVNDDDGSVDVLPTASLCARVREQGQSIVGLPGWCRRPGGPRKSQPTAMTRRRCQRALRLVPVGAPIEEYWHAVGS